MPLYGRQSGSSTDDSLLGPSILCPTGIISKLNSLMANFIWGGSKEKRKYPFTKLRNIMIPKDLGGWGIMDIRTFGKALLCKSLWRGMNGDSLWSTSIRKKYMGNKDLQFWHKKGTIGSPQGSAI